MQVIENSEQLCGYRVGLRHKGNFTVRGYTLIVPPGQDQMIGEFWNRLATDGRLEALKRASSQPPFVLGLGSWDRECPPHGQRYTVCIEQTAHTDFSQLHDQQLFDKKIGASDWLCFQMSEARFHARLWKDDPYQMIQKLGYRFHKASFDVGLHFDVYPPQYHPRNNPQMEFWITVLKS